MRATVLFFAVGRRFGKGGRRGKGMRNNSRTPPQYQFGVPGSFSAIRLRIRANGAISLGNRHETLEPKIGIS
jgi:hypothetical protein